MYSVHKFQIRSWRHLGIKRVRLGYADHLGCQLTQHHDSPGNGGGSLEFWTTRRVLEVNIEPSANDTRRRMQD